MTQRQILMEHEVYVLLERFGAAVPPWRLLPFSRQSAPAVPPDLDASEQVVLKIAARQVPHKGKAGGVLLPPAGPRALVDALALIHQRFAALDPPPAGILVVGRVSYPSRLGDELLLNLRRTAEFGNVFSVAPGGEDAESLARTVTPPIVAATVNDLGVQLRSSWLGSLWRDRESDADARQRIAGICAIAAALESVLGADPSLEEIELNPVVRDQDGRFVALDALAYRQEPARAGEADTRDATTAAPPRGIRTAGIEQLLRPRSVAVVGVSATDRTRPGSIIAANIAAAGILLGCVNPRGDEVDLPVLGSVPLYSNLTALPFVPELVIVTVPAGAALPVIEEAARLGVAAVVIIPGGFSELTGDDSVERQIAAVAEAAAMRVVGPNCLGVVHRSLNTFFIPEAKVPQGEAPLRNLALFSQSGALALVMQGNLRECVRPDPVVSYGNGIDLEPADLVAWAADQKDIDVIAVYSEGYTSGGGQRVATAVTTARHAGKAVIVYKAGRTATGHDATASHTASMSGSYHVASSLLAGAGAIVAGTIDEFILLAGFFAALARYVPAAVAVAPGGNSPLSIALVGNAGYEKAAAADRIDDIRLQAAHLDDSSLETLRGILPPFVSVSSLLDVTPMADDRLYCQALEECLKNPAVDAVLVSIVPHSPAITTTDQETEAASSLARGLVEVIRRYNKPVVCSVTIEGGQGSRYNLLRRDLARGGVAVTTHAEAAVWALARWQEYLRGLAPSE